MVKITTLADHLADELGITCVPVKTRFSEYSSCFRLPNSIPLEAVEESIMRYYSFHGYEYLGAQEDILVFGKSGGIKNIILDKETSSTILVEADLSREAESLPTNRIAELEAM